MKKIYSIINNDGIYYFNNIQYKGAFECVYFSRNEDKTSFSIIGFNLLDSCKMHDIATCKVKLHNKII